MFIFSGKLVEWIHVLKPRIRYLNLNIIDNYKFANQEVCFP